MFRTHTLVCALLLIAATALGAQAVQWQHYSYGDFVLSSAIHSSTLWVGTSTGLVNYNLITQEKQILNSSNSPLPDNWVSSVAVFPSGTLWVGTPAGFCRVGGDEWQYYNTSNAPIPSNRISKICTAADGTLWALSAGNEVYDYIYRFDGSTWTVQYIGNSTIPGQRINDLTLDTAGNPALLYFNTTTTHAGLAVWDGSTWIAHENTALGIPENWLTKLVHDGTKFWISPGLGSLYSWDGTNTVTYNLAIEPYNAYLIHSLSVDHLGRLMIGYSLMNSTQPLILCYDGANWQLDYPGVQVPSLGYVQTLIEDAATRLWLGTYSGMAVYDGVEWFPFSCSNSPIPSNSINYLTVDAQDRVWLSIDDYQNEISGIMNKDGEDWTFYSTVDHPMLQKPHLLTTDSNGKVWIAGRDASDMDAIVSFDGSNWESYDDTNSILPNGMVESMKTDLNNQLWVAYYENGAQHTTIFKYDGTQWLTVGTTQHIIRDIVFDPNGLPWMATDNGLLHFDGYNFIPVNTSNSALPNNDVRSLIFDSEQTLWIGMVDGLAKCSSAGFWQAWNIENGYPFRTFNQLVIDDWDRVWGVTETSGLICFDGETWTNYTPENSPVLGNQLRQFAKDSQQNLWVNGQWNGISRVGLSSSGVDEPSGVPAVPDFALSSYPNPFNPSTTISFRLKEASPVKLDVFNIKGQLVRSLDSSTKAAGEYNIVFDGKDDSGRNIASGVYYLRIAAGPASSTRKILLMK